MSARKITIEPVTRIEGHARITIYLDDAGDVERSYLHVDEFRGLEKFSEGRPYFEMPQITQRICGICPVSHHLAAAKSCDAILGVTPPRPAILLRELLHMAQFVQSHGMHFFYLAGPDIILGFDADPAVRNVFGLIAADPKLALKAVGLRRFGQQIIERLGGKRVHPNVAVPGGVNAPLSRVDRDVTAAEIDTQIEVAQEGVALLAAWVEKNRDLAARFAAFASNYMGMVDPQGRLALYDGEIRICDPAGRRIEQFSPRDYLAHVAEHVEPWSFLKFPFYRKLGWPQGAYRVGPLARLNVVTGIPTPLAQEEFKRFRQIGEGRPVEGSLFYHYARLIELIYALERIEELLSEPEILSADIIAPGPARLGENGIAAIEAPRGTLIHDYSVDGNGLITRANLIVATGHNNWAMNQAVESVAKAFVHGPTVAEGMLNRVEAAVRCYDPCLSCSTHAIGRMPLEVVLLGPDGREQARIAR
ncbi:MAG: Ni/Fe hydrogenase subunit alpha [Desulfobacteraceae bacterium]|nr:MAG: Ni/Fe hydrogenase subunit alpha [Desulfobacteraceae bacterium]